MLAELNCFLNLLNEKRQSAASQCQTLLYNVVPSTPRHERYSNSQRQWC
jgi:hypothetical protein